MTIEAAVTSSRTRPNDAAMMGDPGSAKPVVFVCTATSASSRARIVAIPRVSRRKGPARRKIPTNPAKAPASGIREGSRGRRLQVQDLRGPCLRGSYHRWIEEQAHMGRARNHHVFAGGRGASRDQAAGCVANTARFEGLAENQRIGRRGLRIVEQQHGSGDAVGGDHRRRGDSDRTRNRYAGADPHSYRSAHRVARQNRA